MKSFSRRTLVLLVLFVVTLFTTPAIYASCLYNLTGELGDGFCSCGSSAGPYCMLYNGTDITDAMSPFLEVGCDIMCPGVPYISKNSAASPTPIPRMFMYPKSYQLARANQVELQRLKKMNSASPFARNVTVYEMVFR